MVDELPLDGPATPEQIRTELLRRARALAQPAELPATVDPMQNIEFLRAGSRYALPAGQVLEVLAPGSVAALPGSGHRLAGARGARGELLPVADIAELTRGGAPIDPAACFVVVLDGAEPVGLLAEAVTMGGAEPPSGPLTGATDLIAGVGGDGTVHLQPSVIVTDERLRPGATTTASAPVPVREAPS
jgi:hypothetical protein